MKQNKKVLQKIGPEKMVQKKLWLWYILLKYLTLAVKVELFCCQMAVCVDKSLYNAIVKDQ